MVPQLVSASGLRAYYRAAFRPWVSSVVWLPGAAAVLSALGFSVGLPPWGWALIFLGLLAVIQYRAWWASNDRIAGLERELGVVRAQGAMGGVSSAHAFLSKMHEPEPGTPLRRIYFSTTGMRRVEFTGNRPAWVQFIEPISDRFSGGRPMKVKYPGGTITVHGFTDTGVDLEDAGTVGFRVIADVWLA